MHIEVRTALPGDLQAVRSRFPAVGSDPAGVTLVAWVGELPFGHVQLSRGGSAHAHIRSALPGVPEVRRLRVHPSARGMGVGGRLLNAVEEIVIAEGRSSVGLAVGVDNLAALALYRRCGYVDSGFQPFESSAGLDDSGNSYQHRVCYLVKAVTAPSVAGNGVWPASSAIRPCSGVPIP